MRIAGVIRDEIRSGTYKIGETIPSQMDMAARFEVNRATIKLAEDVLVQEGLLDCIPSVGAVVKAFSRDRTLVGYLVGSLQDPFHMEMIRALDARLMARNAAIMVGEGRSAARLLDIGASKIIKAGQLWSTAPEDTVRTVYVGYSNPSLNCVTVDNEKGMRLLYGYLRELGHERISYLSTAMEAVDEYDVRFKTLMETCPPGIAACIRDNAFLVEGYSEREITDVLETIMGRDPRPTAMICSSDWLAIETMEYAQRKGITIPRDLSIVGFDNIFISGMINTPLTTVSFPMDKAADAIIEILFDDGPPRPVQTIIEPELIVRKSADRPR